MMFYLGTCNPIDLERTDVPLFVSRRRLAFRKRLPTPVGAWSLDSGGFTELTLNGSWDGVPAKTYAAEVARFRDQMPGLRWAAPQDWMCEDVMLRRTGKTVAEHQRLTTDNYLELRSLDADLPFIPVIQGQTLSDYRRHVEQYAAAGVDLAAVPLVGIGSVCRRQSSQEIRTIVGSLTADGLALHGFGMKTTGLMMVGGYMASADSMAWSFIARRRNIRLPGHPHKCCANCLPYALTWREHVLGSVAADPAALELDLHFNDGPLPHVRKELAPC